MRYQVRQLNAIVLAIVVSAGVLTSCGGTSAPNGSAHNNTLENASNTVTIPKGLDVFAPFIVTVQPQTAVVWHNDDTVAHTIVTTPEHATFLNQQTLALTVAPQQSATFTFSQPGLYHYYDTKFATWSPAYQRVAPNTGVPKFPIAMDGVIWVQGSIPGLPKSAKNSVAHLKDRITLNFVAIQQGGSVTWHNYDTDAHFFQPVLGYDAPLNPADIGINNLRGSDVVPPDGESKSITFAKPGLYYYYCFTHAVIDPVLLRVVAAATASEYPIPMEGFVLVASS